MKKNVHTAGKSRKQKKIMLLILEFVIILLLAIALFITTKLSKIEKNKLDMNDVSINDDLSDETKEAMAHYKTIALFGLDNRSNGSLSKGNSDVIMLANIDTKQHTINLVSVYRDSYLDTGNGTYQKRNKAPPKLPRKPVGRVLPRRNPLRPPSKYGSNPPHRPRRHRLPQRQKRAVNAVAVPPARNRPPLHSQAQILPNQR